MSWQDRYLNHPIQSEAINFLKVKKFFKKYFFVIKHSLLPHAYPVGPQQTLPQIKIKENLFPFCEKIYQESIERVNKLEQKAFNLLSYISALFAFISFVFSQSANNFILKVTLIVSMFLLIVAIIISFRCSDVKLIKGVFLPDVYDFEKEPPVSVYNDERASISFLQSAVFNNNIADNLADMLNAARYILMTALVIGFLGSGAVMIHNYFVGSPKENVQLTIAKELKDSALVLKDLLNEIEAKPGKDSLQQSILVLKTRIDSLNSQFSKLKQNFEGIKKTPGRR